MKILINGMLGSGNLGDDLISYCLIRHIEDKYPTSDLYVLSGENTTPIINNNSIKFIPKTNNKINLTSLSNKKRKKRIINSVDKILIGGGGLVQDVHSISTVNSWLNNISSRSDNYLVGMGFGPLQHRINGHFLTYILPFFHIQVRDLKSKNIVEKLGEKAFLSTDIVSGSNLNELFNKSISESSDKVLGIAIRPWRNMEYSEILNLIKYVINTKEIKNVYLFTFEYSETNLSEYNFNKKLYSSINKINTSVEMFTYSKTSWRQYKEAIEDVDFAIASRLHANIIWQKLDIPIIPISYDDKVNSLYHQYEINDIRKNLYKYKDFIKLDIKEKYILPDLENRTIKPNKIKIIMLKCINLGFKATQILNSLKIRLRKNE